MTRKERALRKADRLEMAANRTAVRSTNNRNPFGRGAIAAADAAARAWKKAELLRTAVREREAAAAREKSKKKLPKQWWRGGGASL